MVKDINKLEVYHHLQFYLNNYLDLFPGFAAAFSKAKLLVRLSLIALQPL